MNPYIGWTIGYFLCGMLTHLFLLLISSRYSHEISRDGGMFWLTFFLWWFVAFICFCEWVNDGMQQAAYRSRCRHTDRYWQKQERNYRRSCRK